MTDKHCLHLPVKEDQKAVAMLSLGDVVNWAITTQGCTVPHLEDYI